MPDSINNTLDNIDGNLDNIDESLTKSDEHLDGIENSLDNIESIQEDTLEKLSSITEQLTAAKVESANDEEVKVEVDNEAIAMAHYETYIKDTPVNIIDDMMVLFDTADFFNISKNSDWFADEEIRWDIAIENTLHRILNVLGFTPWDAKTVGDTSDKKETLTELFTELLYNNISSEILTQDEIVGIEDKLSMLMKLSASSFYQGIKDRELVPVGEEPFTATECIFGILSFCQKHGRIIPQHIGYLMSDLNVSFDDVVTRFLNKYKVE